MSSQEDFDRGVEVAQRIFESTHRYCTNRDAIRAIGMLGVGAVGAGLLFYNSNEDIIRAAGTVFIGMGSGSIIGSAVSGFFNRVFHEQRSKDADKFND